MPTLLPTSLQIIACKNNNLNTLPYSIIHCNELCDLKYDNNKSIRIQEEILEYIDQIFAQRINRAYEQERIRENQNCQNNLILTQSVYNNGQNVHDQTINNDVVKSINNILDTKLILRTVKQCLQDFNSIINSDAYNFNIKEDIENIYRTPIEKLEYLCNLEYKHSVIDLTFGQLFIYVWNRIRQSSYHIDIIKILLSELDEMISVCFTGRISRLINCLNGYDNAVKIGISITAQIQAKYNLISKELNQKYDNDSIEYNIIFKYKLYDLLKEIDINEDLINVWTEPFEDNINDYLLDHKLNNNTINELKKKYKI